MNNLDGWVAIVIGAARGLGGLGRAYVLRLASLGARVAVSDLTLNSDKAFEGEAAAIRSGLNLKSATAARTISSKAA